MYRLKNNIFSAEYFMNVLELNESGSEIERIEKTLYNSKINITPHQIQASLFAFKSPLRRGVILADEVGLGKTIEAGIVIAQTWLEKKGYILIISPASLMKQWQEELLDKFNLESIILDRKMYNSRVKSGYKKPLESLNEHVIICSYQMCANFKEEIRNFNFDLVVVDEAHKLRNVYNEKSITARDIQYAVENYKKILLTATPIQNNLMDLFGLCTFIDKDIFADKDVFRYNYIKHYCENFDDLEYRLKPILHRTLRKQVQQYIKFTKRISKTFNFEMNDMEMEIYNEVRMLLENNEKSYLIPLQQRHLLEMILCKLLGSSIHALSFTLKKMRERLIRLKNIEYTNIPIVFDDVLIDEIEYNDDEINITEEIIDYDLLENELNQIDSIIKKADSIHTESKFTALIESLNYAFSYLRNNNIQEKVIIFTESRRTQDYLYEELIKSGFDNIILYNGQNNNENSKQILKEWLSKECNQNKRNNNASVNMKAAIMDKFKEDGKILIATEAGAEGLNLQFCSLVINYDLPWNPQRVEQRIGRCHRIGQTNDVVVINFVSSNNLVEKRIFELLNSKFNLFEEVLGTSDTILGSLEDGKDIEKSILNIYTNCRTTEEINEAFDKLQDEYKEDINLSLEKTKREILENFEEDIQNYFTDIMTETRRCLSFIELTLIKFFDSMWHEKIEIQDNGVTFKYKNMLYSVSSNKYGDDIVNINLNSDLTRELIADTIKFSLNEGHVKFDMSSYPYKIKRIENLIGQRGILILRKLTIMSFEKEEYLVINGVLENGQVLDNEICHKLFRVETYEYDQIHCSEELKERIIVDSNQNITSLINKSEDKNNEYLKAEIKKINKWADDKIQSIENEVEILRQYRKELQEQSDYSTNIIDKEKIENEILLVGKKIRNNWIKLADSEEEIEIQRKKMIADMKKENKKEIDIKDIFMVSFEVV